MEQGKEGGCQCGGVRYRIDGQPIVLAVCHCQECQRQSGSAFGMSLIVPKGSFRLLSGEVRIFTRSSDSGRDVRCAFCSTCGTRIFHEGTFLKDAVNVKPGTLDDTSGLEPALHVWTKQKQPWVVIPADVRSVEGQP